MSVGLYLMTEKGAAVLDAALASGVEIAHVTTAPAAGMNDDSHERIARLAKQHNIPTFERAHPPEFAGTHSVAAGWRWMLDVPDLVVLHDSLLPRYRGFSPLITALVNGEPQVGVTAFLAEAEPDTGPVIAQRSLPVIYPARMRQVLDRLTPLYGEIAADILGTLAAGEPLRYAAQDHTKATWSLWRDEHDYRIDWQRDDRRAVRLVDAASDPFPGAWTTILESADLTPSPMPGYERALRPPKIVRVLAAVSEPDRAIEDRTPGKVAFLVGGDPVVVCATGLVRITDLRELDGEPVRESLKVRFA